MRMLRRIDIDSVAQSRLFGNDLIRAESASRVYFSLSRPCSGLFITIRSSSLPFSLGTRGTRTPLREPARNVRSPRAHGVFSICHRNLWSWLPYSREKEWGSLESLSSRFSPFIFGVRGARPSPSLSSRTLRPTEAFIV